MIILFEDNEESSLEEVASIRHKSELPVGTTNIMSAVKRASKDEVVAWGRDYLKDSFEERNKIKYNERCEGVNLLVNSLLFPRTDLVRSVTSIHKDTVMLQEGRVVAARLSTSGIEPGLINSKSIISLCSHKKEAKNMLLTEYWDFVSRNSEIIKDSFKYYRPLNKSNARILGSEDMVHVNTSMVEDFVTIDSRNGPVIIEEGARIESFTKVSGPSYIGKNAVIHSSLVRGGTSIFMECRIGGEVENSIIMEYTNKAHNGYVGDCIVGSWVNIGAGSNFSNLKNTYGEVRVSIKGKRVSTGMIKLGPLVGDMSKTSVNSTITCGRRIGISSFIIGNVEHDVGSFILLNSYTQRRERIPLDKVIEVQKRMMKRRNVTLTKKQIKLIEYVYERFRD